MQQAHSFPCGPGREAGRGAVRAGCPYGGDVAFGDPVSLSRAPGPRSWVESGKSAELASVRGGGDLLFVLTDRAHLRSAVAQLSPSVGEPGPLHAT